MSFGSELSEVSVQFSEEFLLTKTKQSFLKEFFGTKTTCFGPNQVNFQDFCPGMFLNQNKYNT